MSNLIFPKSSASARMKLHSLFLLVVTTSLGLILGCNNKIDSPRSVLERQDSLADSSMAGTDWNITLDSAWARPTKAGMMSAAYFKLQNNGSTPDSLVRVSSSASEDVQIHLSYEKDEIMVGRAAIVAIQPSEQILFQPGGYHHDLQPTNDMNEGDSLAVTIFQFWNDY